MAQSAPLFTLEMKEEIRKKGQTKDLPTHCESTIYRFFFPSLRMISEFVGKLEESKRQVTNGEGKWRGL